jgi:hypothetical protein
MHRTYCKFALRAGLGSTKQRVVGRAAASLLCIALCAALSACAGNENYPSLAKIADIGQIMTPEERQKAVDDLQKQDQTHSSEAAKTTNAQQ